MTNRRNSLEINISELKMGADNPIRIQSMTTTNTLDTEATVEQAIRIIKAGGELVRVTTQGTKEAENTKNIKQALLDAGYKTPLVADIHFNPRAAEIAALYCDKVRINPGNFLEKRAVFEKIDYTDEEYAQELTELYEKVSGFLNICKENNTALRIGTNQGSLSDRIMSRYGDTPEGMVEATMEFLRICQKESFKEVVISLKSSNTLIMLKAVRLLVNAMSYEGMFYPLHLGVTEAGEGEDGRIKSAVGTGALLLQGIGDTVRVSLTEEPECEIPVAEKLVNYAVKQRENMSFVDPLDKKASYIKSYKTPVVLVDFSNHDIPSFQIPEITGYEKDGIAASEEFQEWKEVFQPAEFMYIDTLGPGLSAVPKQLNVVVPEAMWDVAHVYNRNACPLFTMQEYFVFPYGQSEAKYHLLEIENASYNLAELKLDEKLIVVINTSFPTYRDMALMFAEVGIAFIIKADYNEADYEQLSLMASVDLGHLCIDKLCSGLWISNTTDIKEEDIKKLTFGILQAAHYRMSKTEFISCPGCGRTLFDLQKTVARVKEELSHLNHLKIGVMGCIVNGPGEMGDVDYGYVGAATGKITLYKGREVIKRNIPEDEALSELITFIKQNGDWKAKS
jgi:(E)-4-hydroxy-3-methylbut-2-enyl-diphosphate synthase